MPYEKASAITIRHADYSETSRILTFYTREHGRLTVLAKGAKRRHSRLLGQVELFSYGEIVFISGRLRDRLDILTEACAFEVFPRIRRELPRFYAACHAAELVHATTARDDPNPELFDRLLGLLRRLDRGRDPALALFAFEAHLLVLTGFMPEVSRCVVCGAENRSGRVSFALRLGGIVCERCSPGEMDRLDDLPAAALRLLGRLARGRTTRLDRIHVAPPVVRQMRSFLNEYETYVLGHPLRTALHL